jgi:hypothetical protein
MSISRKRVCIAPKSCVTRLWNHLLPCRSRRRADAHADTADAVQGRANVEREDGRPVRQRWRAVIIDNISDFFAGRTPPDDPVVAVEWWFVAGRYQYRDG